MNDDKVKERFNSFGRKVFDYLYTSYSKNELNKFIENQVIKKDDWMSDERNKFFNEVIIPLNGNTASKNIYDHLKKELC